MKKRTPTPTTDSIDVLFYDKSISIEHIIWLESQSAHFCDELCEYWDDDPAELLQLLGLSAKAFSEEGHEVDIHGDEPMDPEALQLVIARKRITGFLIHATMAVPHNFANDRKSWSSGWGYQQTCWFFTAALDREFVEKLIAWRDGVADRQYTKEHGSKRQKATR